jgi:hypothetical protein
VPLTGGGLYGLALLGLAEAALLPAAGAALQEFSGLHFALAHLVFGLVLGTVTMKRWK